MWDTYAKLAERIYNGDYGNNPTRKEKLTAEGYDPKLAQQFVNYLYYNGKKPELPIEEPNENKNVLEVDVDLNKYSKLVLNFKV